MQTIKETGLSCPCCRSAVRLLSAGCATSPMPAASRTMKSASATSCPIPGRWLRLRPSARAEAAYFDMVNERGGINGRKIKFISPDDSSNPKTAVEQTHELVEKENVLLMFGSFGTPSNLATRTYLNDKKVPQLFVASGDEEWAHPKISVDHGLAADVSRRGTDLRQLHPGLLSGPQDRGALAERPVRTRSVQGTAGRARRYRQT